LIFVGFAVLIFIDVERVKVFRSEAQVSTEALRYFTERARQIVITPEVLRKSYD
jgi:hypothetical protein